MFLKFKILFFFYLFTGISALGNYIFPGEDRVTGPRKDPFSIVPFFGINYNTYPKVFSTQDNKYLCYDFLNGRGFGINYGIRSFYWIDQDIGLSPCFSYSEMTGVFSKTVSNIPINNPVNEIDFLYLEEKVQIEYNSAQLDVLFFYNISDPDIYFMLGPGISYNQRISFKYTENILSPGYAAYLDGSKSKILQDQEYPDYKKFNFLLKSGIGFNYQLNEYIIVNPELIYILPVDNASKSMEVRSIQFNLGFRISIF